MNPSLIPELSAKTTHWASHELRALAAYGFAVVAMAAAMGLRIALTAMFGPGLPAYITFYPMVMAVAMLAGFGPGLMATALSAGIALYYILPPTGQFAVGSPIDRVGLVIYIGMGLFVSTVAEYYRRNRAKALAYDSEINLRESQKALRESRENFVRAQEVGQLGWWRMDTTKDVLTWSDESYRIFGLPKGTPLSYESFLNCVHPDDRDFVHARWMAGLAGEPYDLEHRIVVGGAMKWVREKAYLEFGEDGTLLGGFGVTQDITDRKQAEVALQDANRQKDEFLAMLGHELRNPLTPISNVAQTLVTMPLTGTAMAKAAELLIRNVANITHLVDDLLDVSRITRGLVAINRQPIELSKLLKDTTESIQSICTAKQQTLTLHLPPQLIHLDGDPVRLTQVFSNLLTNASKYTDEKGCINLKVNVEGQSVVVRVQDNGIGIGPQLLPHIFDLFTQGERGLDRSEGGLGLGLTLVKKLVGLHGGQVTAYSQGPGQGSEFVVKLPTLNEISTKTKPEFLMEINTETEQCLRVLMIDDNADVLDSISIWLEMKGHLVKTASNGMKGFSMAQDFAPDIILLDIGMPDMDGYQVAIKLRELPCLQKTKIVAMSGYSRMEELRTDTADFDHYLLKPPKFNDLQNLISECQLAKTGDEQAL